MRRVTQRLTLLLMLLMGVMTANAQPKEKRGEAKSLVGIEVHFRFDKSNLDLSYMGNEEAFGRFAHIVDSIGGHMIDSVVIVSQSSPEGVYEHNMRLSQRRAATMRKALTERHPDLADRLHVHPDGESWERLRNYVVNDTKMKQSTIEQVLRVIDSDVNIGTKKWRMQQLPIYRYLLQTYYPRIRNSVFCIIYYDVPAEVVQIDEVIETEAADVSEITLAPVEVRYVETRRRPLMNVHTNMLYDVLLTPNVGVEFYIGNRWAVAADYTFPWWSHDESHRYYQLLDLELEGRRYFKKDATHTGHYLSLYGQGNLYDLSFDAQRAWQGEGWGAGLGYGYVWAPWKNDRWKLEAFIRFGYYQSLYDPYHAGDPYKGKYYYDWNGPVEDFVRRNHRLRWLGPTGIGINISYDLIMLKKRPSRPPSS